MISCKKAAIWNSQTVIIHFERWKILVQRKNESNIIFLKIKFFELFNSITRSTGFQFLIFAHPFKKN